MIKITLRKNLMYIVQLFLHYYLRRVDYTIIKILYPFNDSLIFTFIMHLGEFFGGLVSYIYQNAFLKKKQDNKNSLIFKLMPKPKMNRIDGNVKIYLLIFFAAFFDFSEYVLLTFFIPKIAKISHTADFRLMSITTISSSLIVRYALKIKIGRHQFYSLIIMGICLFIVLIVELVYQTQVASFGNLFFAYLLTILSLVFITFTDIIEKYLTEFNFINPFIILMAESIIGMILLFSYSYEENPFRAISKFYGDLDAGNSVLLIFLLFLYFVFSAGTNIYKLLSNVLYSPMAKSVATYVLNPLLIIYSYFFEDDFKSDGKQSIVYLIINIILSIIIDFFGCVYNEFFILYCFHMDHETHYIISHRARIQSEEAINDLKTINMDENNEENTEDIFV